MLRESEKQMSLYGVLYDKIPETHLLKRIEKAVDFSFINGLLADSYCKNNGRPAKEPEMMDTRGRFFCVDITPGHTGTVLEHAEHAGTRGDGS